MESHFLRKDRHPGIVQTAHDGVHAAGMARVEDEELAERFYLLRHLHDLIRTDHARFVYRPVVVVSQHVVLALEQHAMSGNEQHKAVRGFDRFCEFIDLAQYSGLGRLLVRCSSMKWMSFGS